VERFRNVIGQHCQIAESNHQDDFQFRMANGGQRCHAVVGLAEHCLAGKSIQSINERRSEISRRFQPTHVGHRQEIFHLEIKVVQHCRVAIHFGNC
jgi:hypothetical protein